MSKLIDLTGQRFGSFTVLKRLPNKNGAVYWECQCDCGTVKAVKSQHLREGKIKTCGLCHAKGLIGQKIQNWTILDITDQRKYTYIVLKCQCDCGNIEFKTLPDIKNTKGKYCQKCHIRDITGQKFGKLTAIKHLGTDQFRQSKWLCKCECGGETIITLGHLTATKGTLSCPQCKASRGEMRISQLLNELRLEYYTQYTFATCKFKSGCLARFDFYLPKQNIIIEYDGEQHFYQANNWEPLEKIQERDAYKTQWCQDNNIPLIRIPYTDYTKLTTEYLLDLIKGVS